MRIQLKFVLMLGILPVSLALAQTGKTFTDTVTAGQFNGVYNPAVCGGTTPPSWCSGSDIGGWVNAAFAAIAATSAACGEVDIPAGTYDQRTTIVKPRCSRLRGQGGRATTLQWVAGPGVAVVAADTAPITTWPAGEIADLTLLCSKNCAEAQALYLGGDPTGRLIAPSANGDDQNFNRLRVYGFGARAIQFGNNAWNNVFFEAVISNNGANAVYFPADVKNSGEGVSFVASSVQNNAGNGLDLLGISDFYFYNFHCDYNVSCGTVYQAHFYGAHIEQKLGPLLTLVGSSAPYPSLELFGGMAAAVQPTLRSNQPDPYLFLINATNPTFLLKGTAVGSAHPVSEMVNWHAAGARSVLDIENLIPSSNTEIAELFNAGFNCNFPGCYVNDGQTNVISQGAQLNLSHSLSAAGLLQPSANTYSGSCTMNSTTSCTFAMSGTRLNNYLSFPSVDHSSSPPAPAISATCTLSGKTVIIRAATANSLTWDCLLIGNPN